MLPKAWLQALEKNKYTRWLTTDIGSLVRVALKHNAKEPLRTDLSTLVEELVPDQPAPAIQQLLVTQQPSYLQQENITAQKPTQPFQQKSIYEPQLKTNLDDAIDLYLGRYDRTKRAELRVADICERTSITKYRLYKELEQRNLYRRTTYYSITRAYSQQVAVSLRNTGVSVAAIAKQLNLSTSTIYSYLR